MNAKDVSEFEYVELNKSGISDEVINNFDCGNQDMSDYLHLQAKTDAAQSKCVTYVLVDSTKSRIYAYSTISSYAMYYYELADKFHTKPMTDDGNVLVTIPAVEIKMFAIDKALRKQVAYILDPIRKRHFSTIFFQWFIEKLYYMSMSVIGFQIIFLRANDEGFNLYSRNGFIEYNEYIDTYDTKAEGCIPMVETMYDAETVLFL